MNELKKKLLEERQTILNSYKYGVANNFLVEETSSDDVDLAEAERARTLSTNFMNKQLERLAALDKALSKVDTMLWGECEACEEAIEPKRLANMPTTFLCLKCQEHYEKHVKSHAKATFSSSEEPMLQPSKASGIEFSQLVKKA